MKGLRQKLNRIVKQNGRISFDTMAKVSMRMGHKPDTGRRQLEPDLSPDVKKIKNNKNHLVAWVHAPDEQESLI
jgi:hypothetical protein